MDDDGSRDPIGASAVRAGRICSTAIGAMTLAVDHRFERTKAGSGFVTR